MLHLSMGDIKPCITGLYVGRRWVFLNFFLLRWLLKKALDRLMTYAIHLKVQGTACGFKRGYGLHPIGRTKG